MSTNSSKHPKETIIKKLYMPMEKKDFPTYLSLISDQIIYHMAGNSFFSGDIKGKKNASDLTYNPRSY